MLCTIYILAPSKDFKDYDNNRIPNWLIFDIIKIDGRTYKTNVECWHDSPLSFKRIVKAGDVLELHVEWRPLVVSDNKCDSYNEEKRYELLRIQAENNNCAINKLYNVLEKVEDTQKVFNICLENLLSKFEDLNIHYKSLLKDSELKEKEITNIRNGWSFRIGRMITYLPRKIMGIKW